MSLRNNTVWMWSMMVWLGILCFASLFMYVMREHDKAVKKKNEEESERKKLRK